MHFELMPEFQLSYAAIAPRTGFKITLLYIQNIKFYDYDTVLL